MPLLPMPNPMALVEGVANRWFGGHLDLPDWPTFLGLGDPMAFFPALVISLCVAMVIGLLVHFLVFRPMRDAPPLAKVVAAVGVMLVLQATITLRFGSDSRTVVSILPASGFRFAGVVIPWDRLLLALMTVVLALLLTLLYRVTRFGLATQAAAENEKGASLLGYSPDVLAGVNWVLAMLMAGLVGILVSPLTTISPVNYTLFVIPALAAALVARFTSFLVAAFAGLGIGMLDQLVQYLDTRPATDWLPARQPGDGAVPRDRGDDDGPRRHAADPRRAARGQLPRAPQVRHPGLGVGVLFAVGFAAMSFLQFDVRQAISTSLIGVILALSLVILTGYVGQISLAQMAIAGVLRVAADVDLGPVGRALPDRADPCRAGSHGAGRAGRHPSAARARRQPGRDHPLPRRRVGEDGVQQPDRHPVRGPSVGCPPAADVRRRPRAVRLVLPRRRQDPITRVRRARAGRRLPDVPRRRQPPPLDDRAPHAGRALERGCRRSRRRERGPGQADLVRDVVVRRRTRRSAARATRPAAACRSRGSPRSQSLSLLAVAYLGGIASVGGAIIAGITILGGLATVLFAKVVHIDGGRSWSAASA